MEKEEGESQEADSIALSRRGFLKAGAGLTAMAATGSTTFSQTHASPRTMLDPSDQAAKPADLAVKALNISTLSTLPFANRDDFRDASRGFVATLPDALVTGTKGNAVWSQKDYAFLEKEAPDTVNPSLWRQAQLNHLHGLFKVIDGLYQIRGFDISNMTLIEGDTGLIVIDPLLSVETARAGLELYYQHRPRRPVVAVIYTHSHPDRKLSAGMRRLGCKQ